jgi:hypothetical protein
MNSPSTTTERLTPRLGIVGSAVLHACVIVAAFFGVAHKLEIIDQSTPIIPVDLVTIADKTNIAPETAAQPLPAPPVPDMIEPQAPQPEAPQVDIAPPESKPVPQKTPPKKNTALAFNEMLNNLNVPKVGTRDIQGVGAETGLTADLRAILQSEIQPCWNPPQGAPHVEDLIVTYKIYLNADGTVAEKPQLTADSAAAVARNPYTRAAADAAYRAIYQCQPFKLPANRYKDWREFAYHFDPRDMLGQ